MSIGRRAGHADDLRRCTRTVSPLRASNLRASFLRNLKSSKRLENCLFSRCEDSNLREMVQWGPGNLDFSPSPAFNFVLSATCHASSTVFQNLCHRDGGTSLVLSFQPYYRFCLDNTDKAAPLSRCATQGPDLRTSSPSATRERRALLTSWVARSRPASNPEAVTCKVGSLCATTS